MWLKTLKKVHVNLGAAVCLVWLVGLFCFLTSVVMNGILLLCCRKVPLFIQGIKTYGKMFEMKGSLTKKCQ